MFEQDDYLRQSERKLMIGASPTRYQLTIDYSVFHLHALLNSLNAIKVGAVVGFFVVVGFIVVDSIVVGFNFAVVVNFFAADFVDVDFVAADFIAGNFVAVDFVVVSS